MPVIKARAPNTTTARMLQFDSGGGVGSGHVWSCSDFSQVLTAYMTETGFEPKGSALDLSQKPRHSEM